MKIGMIAATQMACAPPADSVERAYLDALGQADGWRMDGSALVLLNGDGDELLRYEAASPAGDWEATSIQTGDALASPLPGTTITAKFADDGTLSGSAGRNSYTTSYTLDGGESKSPRRPPRGRRARPSCPTCPPERGPERGISSFASRGRWVSCSYEHVESMDRAKALAQGAHLTRQAPSSRRTARPRGAACTPAAGVSALEQPLVSPASGRSDLRGRGA